MIRIECDDPYKPVAGHGFSMIAWLRCGATSEPAPGERTVKPLATSRAGAALGHQSIGDNACRMAARACDGPRAAWLDSRADAVRPILP